MDSEADLRLNPPFREYRPSWYGEKKREPFWVKGLDPDKFYVLRDGKWVESPIQGMEE